MRVFILIAALGIITSCFSNKTVTESGHTQKQDTLLVLRQTSCYGTCPVYTFTLLKNGYALYEGIRHVPHIGKYTALSSTDDLISIEKLTKELNIKGLKDEYTGYATDLPSTYLTYYFDDQTKNIYAYQNIPEELKEYVTYLRSFSENLQWQPAKD